MAYSDFDLRTVVRTFGLEERREADLFADVRSIEPSAQLSEWLSEFSPVALGVNSEKARSESIVMPILAEAKRRSGVTANVLSGVTFDVDRASGLGGCCDFLIARSAEFYYVQAPIVAVVEAKKEDLVSGLGQCAAEMVAIRRFNERERVVPPRGLRMRHERQHLEIPEVGRKYVVDRPPRILPPGCRQDSGDPGPGDPGLSRHPDAHGKVWKPSEHLVDRADGGTEDG